MSSPIAKRGLVIAAAVAAALGTALLATPDAPEPAPPPPEPVHVGEPPYVCPSGLPSWIKPNNDC